jgi:hypothetical protein
MDAVRLIELLQQAAEWNDEEASIYAAQPWSCDAEAVLVNPLKYDGANSARRDQLDYFIKFIIAREFIEDMWHLAKVGNFQSATLRASHSLRTIRRIANGLFPPNFDEKCLAGSVLLRT